MKWNYMKAKELDEKFDNGEDVLDLFDLTTLKRPALETQLICVDSEEAITGIQSGLDDFEAGHFRSFQEFAKEQRHKHR
jgi:hypothetical protein